MHPAPSVILFTVLSGLGFGALAFLGLGLSAPQGLWAFINWGLGYGLAVGGLLASTFHLGNPQRFLRAFTQWRSSWLSREAWTSVATLLLLAPVALSDIFGLGWPRGLGVAGAVLAGATILTTAMIYAQMKSIPRWNHWTTPTLFFSFALTGGAIVTGNWRLTAVFALGLGGALIASFVLGDQQFAKRGSTIGTATGLDRIGTASVFELPHTGGNYLLREMIYVVGRKHSQKLRAIAVIASTLLPVVVLLVLPDHWLAFAFAALVHLLGAVTARWLFFAEAEHVVGLYYGKR